MAVRLKRLARPRPNEEPWEHLRIYIRVLLDDVERELDRVEKRLKESAARETALEGELAQVKEQLEAAETRIAALEGVGEAVAAITEIAEEVNEA